MIRPPIGKATRSGTMSDCAFKLRWFAVQIAIACLVVAIALVHANGTTPIRDAFRPIVWGTAAALVHSLLGLRLFGSTSEKRRNSDIRIRSGLILLALRYFTGVGLLVAGLFAFPPFRTLCVASWLGSFILLTLSELIVFVKGVHRL